LIGGANFIVRLGKTKNPVHTQPKDTKK